MVVIVVELHETTRGYPRWFRVMGHAGFDATGRDIVCAGVSAIAQTVLRALREQVIAPGTFEDDGGTLLVKPDWVELRRRSWLGRSVHFEFRTKALLDAAWLGFQEIAKAYPGHVTVNVIRNG